MLAATSTNPRVAMVAFGGQTIQVETSHNVFLIHDATKSR